MKNIRFINNNNGLTMFEVLASMVIISMISTLLFSMINNAQKSKMQQENENTEVKQIAYDMKMLNLEMRKSNEVLCTSTTDIEFSTLDKTSGVTDLYFYNPTDKILYKNNKSHIKNVDKLYLTCDNTTSKVLVESIEIEIKKGNPAYNKIVIRGGDK